MTAILVCIFTLDKPVVKKCGLDLHESIKQNITRRAKSASLILGQRRMTAEPFLLKVCTVMIMISVHHKPFQSDNNYIIVDSLMFACGMSINLNRSMVRFHNGYGDKLPC